MRGKGWLVAEEGKKGKGGEEGTGRDRKGQEGTGRDRKGQEGTGRDRKGQEGKVKKNDRKDR